MLISRGLGLYKTVAAFSARRAAPNKIQVRNSGSIHTYRDIWDAPKYDIWMAEGFMGLMWWWVLWHCWHDWGHIVGEFPYPEPEKWTDAELGIPPDDVDA